MWNKQTLIIAIITLCTAMLWIFFDAYHTYKTSTIPDDLKEDVKEFDPSLDTEVLYEIKQRPERFEVSKPTPTPKEETNNKEGEKKEEIPAKITVTPTVSLTITATPTTGEGE